MSAIDTTFTWVRNPTAINGLATTYVSKRGSDVSGDGTAQNPYASIAKATSVATGGTNIMLDDGEWDEVNTNNGRRFVFWGNGETKLSREKSTFPLGSCRNSSYSHLLLYNIIGAGNDGTKQWFTNCICVKTSNPTYNGDSNYENCVLLEHTEGVTSLGGIERHFNRCLIINSTIGFIYAKFGVISNSILMGKIPVSGSSAKYVNCNFTTLEIPSNVLLAKDCINNATTGQTLADYFNYVHPNVLANPSTATIDDWLQCDFTAKAGSKNIGAGEKGTTIGFNQGFTMYADNSANDMFSPSNGATLKNIAWDNTLNGYVLVQKERFCQGATSNTITLDSSASAIDDYYNNLFIGIVGGDGFGELFLISDYDGATKTATIDGTWNTTPNTNSIYTISGTILSAIKDFGKAIKVKRNWTFADNFTTLADGRWVEFLTNLTSQGKELPVNCFLYEYSTNGTNWMQGHTSDDLVSATNGENKIYDKIYGDCSPNYDEASAKDLVMRYIRINVHIGFNI